ncbi:antimicrobial peptide microplusin-like [Ixodes scapularis]
MKILFFTMTALLLCYSSVSLDYCELEYPDLHKWAVCVGLHSSVNLRTRILEVGKALSCRNFLCTFGKFCLEGSPDTVLPVHFTAEHIAELETLWKECSLGN